jgi:hypothetical protein
VPGKVLGQKVDEKVSKRLIGKRMVMIGKRMVMIGKRMVMIGQTSGRIVVNRIRQATKKMLKRGK